MSIRTAILLAQAARVTTVAPPPPPPPLVPAITTDAAAYLSTGTITCTVEDGPGGAANTIALYRAIDDPASAVPLASRAFPYTAGWVAFSALGLPVGSYRVALTSVLGPPATVLAVSAAFTISLVATITDDHDTYTVGDLVTAAVANGPAVSTNAVALFVSGANPSVATPIAWAYLASGNKTLPGAGVVSGSVAFSTVGLAVGNYDTLFVDAPGAWA